MKTAVRNAIHRYGELVEITYKDSGQTVSVSASVQRPVSDNIVGDFETTAFVVYIAVADIAVAPKKFDRMRIRGEIRSVETAHVEESREGPICHVLRSRG
jgi:hypothetical protein